MADDWQTVIPKAQRKVAVPKKVERDVKRATINEEALPNPAFKFRHTLFLGGIGDLTEEDILNHFKTLYPGDMHISCEVKLGSFATVLLGNSAIAAELIQQRWTQINSRNVEMKPYSLAGANPHYAQTKMHEDQVMQSLEAKAKERNAAANALRVIRHIEDRTDLPAIFTPGREYNWLVSIKNDGPQPRVLTKVEGIPKNPNLFLTDQIRRRKGEPSQLTLGPGESHKVKVTFKPKPDTPVHMYRISVVSTFSNNQIYSTNLSAAAANEKDTQILDPTSQPAVHAPESLVREIVPAFPTSGQNPRAHLNVPIEPEWMSKLEQYPIPTDVQADIEKYSHYRDLNAWNLRTNYKRRLHSLLWIEEAQNKADMRAFDMVETPIENLEGFEVNGKMVFEKVTRLEVQGLAEKRPSILYNDYVYAWLPGSSDKEYEGWVYKVERTHLLIVFCEGFQELFPSGTKLNFRFTFNRMHLRVMHTALDAAQIDLIWPEMLPTPRPPKHNLSSVRWFDVRIKDNAQQAQAVLALLNNTNQHCPYLIFGPFGTGKTRTLIEIIKQILTVGDEKTKILCCAPSNSASDAFVEHLRTFLTPKQMFRLYAFNRSLNTVPATCRPYTLYNPQSQLFDIPPLADLLAYQVIVTTSSTAGSLVGVGVPRGHYTHIILDEAAQMWEAEALIPVSLATNKTSIVMAGDDKQMGPKVQSKTVRHHKMDLSIMDRLVETSKTVYNDRHAADVCIQLVQNYRQHPQLLDFPSRMFYDGKLIAKANPRAGDLNNWEKLPEGHNAPMLFSAVEGEDLREGDSPSFFNRMEVLNLVDLVENLTVTQNVQPADIGIVTAFYKQTQKIRMLLRERGLKDIKVGSTEEFQGHEKRALFVSTVRSSRSYYEYDKKYQLGFTENSKRVNTTFSRAASLLVVVGDPYALYQDPIWKSFIDFCVQINCYDGPALSTEYFQQRTEQDVDRGRSVEEQIKADEDVLRVRHEIAIKQQQREQSIFENRQTEPAVPAEKPTAPAVGSGKAAKPASTPVVGAGKSAAAPSAAVGSSSTATAAPASAAASASTAPSTTPAQTGVSQLRPTSEAWPEPQPAAAVKAEGVSAAVWAEPEAAWSDGRQWGPGGPPGLGGAAVGYWPALGVDQPFFRSPYELGGPQGDPSVAWRAHSSPALRPNDYYDFGAGYPSFAPTIAQSQPAPTDDISAYSCIYRFNEKEFLHYQTTLGYPPLSLTDRGHYLELKLSTFNSYPDIKQQGNNRIFITLVADSNLEGVLFSTPSLHSSVQEVQSTSKLLLTLPEEFSAQQVEISVSPNVVTVLLPKKLRTPRQGR